MKNYPLGTIKRNREGLVAIRVGDPKLASMWWVVDPKPPRPVSGDSMMSDDVESWPVIWHPWGQLWADAPETHGYHEPSFHGF